MPLVESGLVLAAGAERRVFRADAVNDSANAGRSLASGSA